jgi:tetratricopeptide (TPR) repeat protein
MDFDTLQAFADRSLSEGRFGTALAVYLHMAEGDPSLDGGSLGHAIGECYEKLGQPHAARYWYRRAVEENPSIELYRRDFERMGSVGVEDLLRAS